MLSKIEVLKIAHLARLELSDEEAELMKQELSKIIEYVNEINSAKADAENPTFQTFEKQTLMREDKPRRNSETEEILKNAPSRRDNYFSVPKVIE